MQIAGGLEAAHDAGVVHRDLKPANIMISGAGDEQHALIMDFGISASADEATDGRIVGTLEYMSPGAGHGQTVDARSDLYAFGLILYEMLAGRRPTRIQTAEERIAAMKQRFEEGLPPLQHLRPNRFPSRSRRSSRAASSAIRRRGSSRPPSCAPRWPRSTTPAS